MATTVIRGSVSPEGLIEAPHGSFYINTQSSLVYVKITGEVTTTTGWKGINAKGYYENSGTPGSVVSAPQYALCYDSQNQNIYMQTSYSSSSLLNTGWVSMNLGTLYENHGVPQIAGVQGDLYIDLDTYRIYLKASSSWMQIPLMSAAVLDITTNLSELLTNSTSIVSKYFDMFYNPQPMDVTLTQYDADGILKTYNIPNRAKDINTLVGEGSPEGVIYAVQGKLYLDTVEKAVYIKTTTEYYNTGWIHVQNTLSASAPLVYNSTTNVISVSEDSAVTSGSTNLVNSGVLYNKFNSIKNGSPYEVYAVADPIEDYHATPKSYVQEISYAKLNKNQITNCILEDTQNIHLELNNGTLTLKAGSVICVPNGFESDGTTPKFDEVTIVSDKAITRTGSGQWFVTAKMDVSAMILTDINSSSSGSSPTPANFTLQYNTTDNTIKRYNTLPDYSQSSFPIAIVTIDSNGIASIDQTFQSIGYIGSTVFVRKGLKVLIPNGRNADGSLKNIERKVDSVYTKTGSGNVTNCAFILNENSDYDINLVNYSYNNENNYCYYNNSKTSMCIVAKYTKTSGVISNFQPCTVTNILKYSDSFQISGWALPSVRYINLTLGSSGATYTAPANGWVVFSATTNATNGYIQLDRGVNTRTYGPVSGANLRCYIPIAKGDTFSTGYNSVNTSGASLRFYYAEGEIF